MFLQAHKVKAQTRGEGVKLREQNVYAFRSFLFYWYYNYGQLFKSNLKVVVLWNLYPITEHGLYSKNGNTFQWRVSFIHPKNL